MDFGDAFWLSITGMLLTATGLVLKSCLSSKCSNTEFCWGCLKIVRDVDVEEDIELAIINRPSHSPIVGDNNV